MTLKYFNFTWRDIDNFMSSIGGMRCITANKCAEAFINGDLDVVLEDGRGGKRIDSFFDEYPEIEVDSKSFVVDAVSRNSADFKIVDLANFIDSSYYALTNTKKCQNDLIRSVTMCRLDLKRWGFSYDANTQRPYYKGHDRPDVLAYRQKFLEYFLSKKQHYYLIDSGDHINWCIPSDRPRILICK